MLSFRDIIDRSFLSVKDNAGNFYKIYTGNKNSAGLFALTVLLF